MRRAKVFGAIGLLMVFALSGIILKIINPNFTTSFIGYVTLAGLCVGWIVFGICIYRLSRTDEDWLDI